MHNAVSAQTVLCRLSSVSYSEWLSIVQELDLAPQFQGDGLNAIRIANMPRYHPRCKVTRANMRHDKALQYDYLKGPEKGLLAEGSLNPPLGTVSQFLRFSLCK